MLKKCVVLIKDLEGDLNKYFYGIYGYNFLIWWRGKFIFYLI